MANPRKTNLSLRTASTVFDRAHRAVVLEFDPATPALVAFRLAGCRQRVTADAGHVFTMLLQRQIEAEKREKRKARKGGKRK